MTTGSTTTAPATRIRLLLLNVQQDVENVDDDKDDSCSGQLLDLLKNNEILRNATKCRGDGSLDNTVSTSNEVHRQITKFLQKKDKYTALASMLLKSRAFHEARCGYTQHRCLSLVDLPRTQHNQPYIPSSSLMSQQSAGRTKSTIPITKPYPLSISHQFPMVGMAQMVLNTVDDDINSASSAASLTVGMDIVVFDALNTRLYNTQEEFLEVFRDQFVEREWQTIQAAAATHKIKKFYIQWAIKEAYTKARGLGMGIPFNSFFVEMQKEEWNNGESVQQPLWEQITATQTAATTEQRSVCFKATIKHVANERRHTVTRDEELYIFFFLPLWDKNNSPNKGAILGCACICVGPFENPEDQGEWWQRNQLDVKWTSIQELMDWHEQPGTRNGTEAAETMNHRTDDESSNVSHLPPSVGSLADCIKHEINVMEKRFQELLEQGDLVDDEQQQRRCKEMELLEDALDDGFMCIDLHVLKRKLHIWHNLFSSNDGIVKVTPYYAIKCNPDPWLAHYLANSSSQQCPVGFDCASLPELRLAKAQLARIFELNGWKTGDPKTNGIPNTRIVYANPQRAEADLMQALVLFASVEVERCYFPPQDLWLTLDGVEEISKIAKARDDFLAKQRERRKPLQIPKIQLIFRIWVPDGHSQVPLGEKFGASLDDIPKLVEACHTNELLDTVIGISFHCGSGCESVETYQEALGIAQEAIELVDKECNRLGNGNKPHKCWLLDIGGGFPGVDGIGGDEGRFVGLDGDGNKSASAAAVSSTKTTTVATIATAIQPMLKSLVQDQQLTLIAEPGRYFVEGAALMASRIYWRSKNDDTIVYKIAHGVQGVFKDVILCNEVFTPTPLPMESTKSVNSKELYPSKIIGPSGDPQDVVNAKCMLPELTVGDWLVFDRMGAYTMSIASKAGRPVVRYVCGGGSSYSK